MDSLDLVAIRKDLKTKLIGKKIILYDEIESTSDIAKIICKTEPNGTLIIADTQTKGRGRQGNAWISPPGVGIWMSIIMKPEIDIKDAVKLSPLVALSIQKALTQCTGLSVSIKWPNDIIINKKKVCGILVESIIENDCINSLIVGIGINVNQTDDYFPEELKYATSLRVQKGHEMSREEIISAILVCLEKYYKEFIKSKQLNITEMESTSVLFGKKIVVTYNNSKESIIGTVVGFLEDGSILIKNEDGNIININSVKASIRGLNSYID